MEKIKALIVDDEKHCSDNLAWQLKNYCPSIEVAMVCDSAEKAARQITAQRPDLVFLDVEMPGMNGFALLQQLTKIDFNIIFTTAHDQYAIRAIKFGALDYLLKPVDKDDLRQAIDKHVLRSMQDPGKQLTALLSHIKKGNDLSFQKIALPTMHGYELVPLNKIIVCESKNNYTDICLEGGNHIVISKTLKQISELLDMPPFLRVHNSFLVNLEYAIRYVKGEGGMLILNNGESIPVSRSKKEELIKLITHLSV